MRALVQRVIRADVRVADEVVGTIGAGLCVFVGVTHTDDETIARRLAEKIWNLRVFDSDRSPAGRSVGEERSVAQATGAVLVVSQFTLYGDTSKGRRPSWVHASRPDHAEPLVDLVASSLGDLGARVATGRFGADMQVELVNDGPFTVMLEL